MTKQSMKLSGAASCSTTATAPGVDLGDPEAASAYPLTGKLKIDTATNHVEVFLATTGTVDDVFTLNGTVTKGPSVGAAVTGGLWEDPAVALLNTDEGYPGIGDSGYAIDPSALATLVGCADGTPNTVADPGVTTVLIGDGVSPLQGNSAPGLSFTFEGTPAPPPPPPPVVSIFDAGNPSFGATFDGVNVWLTNPTNQSVTKVNAATNAVSAPITVGPAPTGVASDGTNIWVANTNDTTVTKIDAATGAVLATITVAPAPFGVAFDGTNIWVVSVSGTVSKIDPATDVVLSSIPVGVGPRGIASDGTNMWVANHDDGTVSKINATTDAVSPPIAVGTDPEGVAFDGTDIWVSNAGAGTVSRINVTTDVVSAPITVGANPRGIVSDGTHVWVANAGDGTVSKIDPATNSVESLLVGGTPGMLAFDGTKVWVTNATFRYMSQIRI